MVADRDWPSGQPLAPRAVQTPNDIVHIRNGNLRVTNSVTPRPVPVRQARNPRKTCQANSLSAFVELVALRESEWPYLVVDLALHAAGDRVSGESSSLGLARCRRLRGTLLVQDVRAE